MEQNKPSAATDSILPENFQKVANRVSVVTITGNLILSVMKFLAGTLAHSSAMISDAVHSASDVFSTVIVMIGIKFSSKESDKEHPYGHERLECVAALILAMVLFLTGLGIGIDALKNILPGSHRELQIPGMFALAAAVISIISKELMADAWHHRSDAFSSVGALIGIAGARLGFPVMDPIASLVIFGFILKAAYDIFKDAVDKMVDHSCDDQTEKEIHDCTLKHPEVKGIDLLQTRIFGNKIYVDLEIALDGSYSLQKAHEIAEEVHDDIEQHFPKIKHIMVHVNPVKK